MEESEFKKIINYIVNQGLVALENIGEKDAVIDYVAIFSKDEEEFKNLELVVKSLSEEALKENTQTGKTFSLKKPIETPVGNLSFIKIRRPDATRPQRGDVDFKVKNYPQFKDKYLQSSGNFTLMTRKNYEMIEIKGVDVLVYIPSKTFNERI